MLAARQLTEQAHASCADFAWKRSLSGHCVHANGSGTTINDVQDMLSCHEPGNTCHQLLWLACASGGEVSHNSDFTIYLNF